jgi:hypothetical protein
MTARLRMQTRGSSVMYEREQVKGVATADAFVHSEVRITLLAVSSSK